MPSILADALHSADVLTSILGSRVRLMPSTLVEFMPKVHPENQAEKRLFHCMDS
jgi:hypothetical protein